MRLQRSRRIGIGPAVLAVACLAAATVQAADDAAAPAEPEVKAFSERVQPLLTRYCHSCHGASKPKAGLNLVKFNDIKAIDKDRKTWEKVLENIEAGLMPPSEKPQPTEEEAAFLAEWIEARVTKAACDGTPRPGRVTIRRLNRAEYDNTVRDLLGIDFHPAADFPTDDVGYGFDNIGDVLTLSPILLEKYLNAAEQIAGRAILTDRTDYGRKQSYRGPDLRRAGGSRFGEEGRILPSNGAIRIETKAEKAGDYLIRVRAFGQQAGDEPAKMAIRVDDDDEAKVEVSAVEGDPAYYDVRVKLDEGRHTISAVFLNDFYDAKAKDSSRCDRNLVVLGFEIQGPIRPNAVPLPESHRRLIQAEPVKEDGKSWKAAARRNLEPLANRAYRRPVTPEELDRLVRLVMRARQDDDSFPKAMQFALQAVLVSPHFLFRVELDRGGGVGPAVPIDDFALASRLSYFLWSSMPDDELFQLAGAGKLRDAKVLEKQVHRMLADPRSSALVENFGMQWLTLRGLDAITPDPKVIRGFDEKLKADMIQETRAFFTHVIHEDRSILDFLDSDYTFVNERLARHYNIKDVTGDEFRKVRLEGDQRGGVLTQASILTVTSNPTRTSPVKRGKWVLEQILGTPPPPPPPDVPELSESKEAILSGTLRERLERHRADPNCAVCHSRLDPLGFVFENYDAVGAWREKEGDFTIDASGSLPSGESFRNAKEFKAYLLNRKGDFARALTEKLLTYALGRGLEYDDACEVDRIAAAMPSHDYKFSNLVLDVVTSVPFRMREGQGSKP